MKTASVRDVRHDFARVLGWIAAGEEVAITMRRQTVARLVPWKRERGAKRPMPDIAARLKKVFGDKVIADHTMQNLMELN